MKEYRLENVRTPLVLNRTMRTLIESSNSLLFILHSIIIYLRQPELIFRWYDALLIVYVVLVGLSRFRVKPAQPMFIHFDEKGFRSRLVTDHHFITSEKPRTAEVELVWNEVTRISIHALHISFQMISGFAITVYLGQLGFKEIREIKSALTDVVATIGIPVSSGDSAEYKHD